MPEHKPVVIIVGGGFGGLAAARALKKAPVKVVLIGVTTPKRQKLYAHGFPPLPLALLPNSRLSARNAKSTGIERPSLSAIAC